MRIHFIRQTKGKSREVAHLVAEYVERYRAYASVELHEPKSKGQSKTETKGATDKYDPPAIWLEPSTRRIVLDEHGKQYTSMELAAKLTAIKDDPGAKAVAFFIGSPYGIPQSVLDTRHEKWSLSKGTFPADLAWLVLIEQVYRGLSIVAGSPYHHE